MRGVRVPTKEAQSTKNRLIALDALDTGRKVLRDGDFVIFPLKADADAEGFETVSADFKSVQRHRKFRDALRELLTPGELSLVKRAFDTIGDIAIIEVPPELEAHEKAIAKALTEAHKNIRSVYRKSGDIKGEERTREFKFLHGEERTETIYREHGMKLKLDISKVYFSPRLSAERERILAQTEDREVVVDLFAGIGPFSILLAKYRDLKVYAIDINLPAFEYLKENIRINKVGDRVIPLLGDCREVAPKDTATRVIMNLPKSSDRFLDLAFDIIKEGVIHYYTISPEEDLYDSKVDFIKKAAEKRGKTVEILNRKIVRPYAPYNHHVAIDVLVK